jgi:hypothetical protein
MKKSNHSAIRYQFLLVLLFLVQFAQAQPTFDDGDDVNDAVPAPIDDWILPMMLLGVGIVFFYLKKRQPAIK